MKSEAVKILKGEYVVKAISALNMDQAIIFCRTKLDCDNIERYLLSKRRGALSCQFFVILSVSYSLFHFAFSVNWTLYQAFFSSMAGQVQSYF